MGMPLKAGLVRSRPPAERASLRMVAGYIRPHWRALLAGGLLSLATGATGLLLPLVVRALIDGLSHHRGLTVLIAALCLLMLADAALGSAGNYVLLRTGETITLTARLGLVARLLRITVAALDRSEPGDLMARATVDTTLLRNAVTNAVVPGVVGLLTTVAALVAMGLVDSLLLLATLGAVACIGVMEGLVLPRIGRATRRAQEAVGAMTAALERIFGAFRTVKAAGAGAREEAHVREAAQQAWRASLRADFWQAVVGNTTELATQFAFLAVLATGAAQVATHAISVGTLVAFLMYILFLMGPINQVVSALTQYQVGAAGRLPDGLDTFIGHRGTRLSGGERQRVAIARALLRRPRLLLLDEATSQLDAINEAALRDTVSAIAQRITVLVVAHRLSTVTMADRIIVMDAGRVQATGTHAELVAASPLYAELAATQFLATAAPGN
ncbi:MAG TPA: ABC transporter ATP-binding protein [Streptosporangiaceae bacterium]